MRILIDIGHPAHVHLFKNMIWNLEKKGHEIKITARDKEVALYLLDTYGFKYECLGKHKKGLLNKAIGMLEIDWKLYKIAKRFTPDIMIGGVGNLYIPQVSKLLRKPSLIFDDTEHARLEHLLGFYFATTICTPSCYTKDFGEKQIRYNGYHELAYLHPNYFKPNPAVLDDLGLGKGDTFIILRFVSWSASHDVGQRGIKNEIGLVKELEKYGHVFITSEGKIDGNLEKYKIKVSPEKIHDLLYYATMYIGEGATMASEAGILGTSSVYISSLVGTMGNFEELEARCGLVYSFRDSNQAFEKAIELLENENLKSEWGKKKEKMLREKIDVTAFMTWFIENYPESFKLMKQNPEYQGWFK